MYNFIELLVLTLFCLIFCLDTDNSISHTHTQMVTFNVVLVSYI